MALIIYPAVLYLFFQMLSLLQKSRIYRLIFTTNGSYESEITN